MTSRWRVLAAVLLLPLLAGNAPATDAFEYQLKGAFLYNFAKYVEWPDESTDSLAIGVVGDEALTRLLAQTLAGKKIRDKRLEVRRADEVAAAAACQILLFSRVERERVVSILGDLRGVPVLTVGDGREFVADGGMIGFLQEGNKLRFAINDEAATHSGLQISSQVLKLATVVVGSAPQ